jgi:archaellum biogenesis protein FlaJ (TadC family)
MAAAVDLTWLPIDMPIVLRWVVWLSVVTFLGSLILVPVVVVRMPADYFVRSSPSSESWTARHPVIRICGLVAKNVLGLVFVLSGLVMLFIPGQGILVTLLGISLLDVPGKRNLERKLISIPRVGRAINALRARAGRPPLDLEEPPPADRP